MVKRALRKHKYKGVFIMKAKETDTTEALSDLMQQAVVMVSKTARDDEDMVQSARNLQESLHQAFERNGIQAAQTRFDVEKTARTSAAALSPPTPSS